MSPSLGWQDPIWKQLYGQPASSDSMVSAPDTAEPGPVDYLNQLQQAAAANVTLNLSDMPGYQTNLHSPSDG
ncbi:MAG: hypothetical protein LW834_16370 [Cyanobium sp. 49614_E6]|jgi:hypothetical protein|nr:hypothetical protein [Cyanobium sp. 49614_E6]